MTYQMIIIPIWLPRLLLLLLLLYIVKMAKRALNNFQCLGREGSARLSTSFGTAKASALLVRIFCGAREIAQL